MYTYIYIYIYCKWQPLQWMKTKRMIAEWIPAGYTKCCMINLTVVPNALTPVAFLSMPAGMHEVTSWGHTRLSGLRRLSQRQMKRGLPGPIAVVDPATSIQMASSCGNPSHPHLARLSPNTPGDSRKMELGTAHVPGLGMYKSHSQNFFFWS